MNGGIKSKPERLISALFGAAMFASGSVSAEPPTLEGRVICGYQGWFGCPGDGSGRGWVHWSREGGTVTPTTVTFDLWPDTEKFPADALCSTGFKEASGQSASLYRANHPGVIDVHFEWMRQHGIDGVFFQRFGTDLAYPSGHAFADQVLAYGRQSARRHGRVWGVMYDLSGMRSNTLDTVMDDWSSMEAGVRDAGYLHEDGRPLVALWGAGFNDGRNYSIGDCARLVAAFHTSGAAVLLGVPTYWREGTRDAVSDPAFLKLCESADVLLPWTVGRYHDTATLTAYGATMRDDAAWCRAHGIRLLPVCFPGFSWHNLKGGPLDEIPRRRGEFFWQQFELVRSTGLNAAYVAMFDEFDEGTAIAPYRRDPPTNQFVPREAVPADHYLRLAGAAGELLRGTRKEPAANVSAR